MPEKLVYEGGILTLLLTWLGWHSNRLSRVQKQIDKCQDVRVDRGDMEDIKKDIKEIRTSQMDMMYYLGIEKGRHNGD